MLQKFNSAKLSMYTVCKFVSLNIVKGLFAVVGVQGLQLNRGTTALIVRLKS